MEMKRLIRLALLGGLFAPLTWGKTPAIDIYDDASLQRGARTYMNYCAGCHSLKYIRYSTMAEGLGLIDAHGQLDKPLLQNNLIFTQAAVTDPVRIAMPSADAQQWFGVVPPDLSLITREKGIQWLYTYLNSFYNDDSRPFGTNNRLVPGVAMPDILEPLRGEMHLVARQQPHSVSLVLVKKGELSQQEFKGLLQDLLTFLAYVGEPAQRIRYTLGWYVLGFIAIFLFVALNLKNIYWRKIE